MQENRRPPVLRTEGAESNFAVLFACQPLGSSLHCFVLPTSLLYPISERASRCLRRATPSLRWHQDHAPGWHLDAVRHSWQCPAAVACASCCNSLPSRFLITSLCVGDAACDMPTVQVVHMCLVIPLLGRGYWQNGAQRELPAGTPKRFALGAVLPALSSCPWCTPQPHVRCGRGVHGAVCNYCVLDRWRRFGQYHGHVRRLAKRKAGAGHRAGSGHGPQAVQCGRGERRNAALKICNGGVPGGLCLGSGERERGSGERMKSSTGGAWWRWGAGAGGACRLAWHTEARQQMSARW